MPEPDSTAVRRPWKIVAWLMVVTYVVGVVAVAWLERNITAYPATLSIVESLLLSLGFFWFVLIGAVVVSRQPRNAIGWILAMVGLPIAVFAAGNNLAAYIVLEQGHEPGLLVSLIAWPNNWYWFAVFGLAFICLPLLFPDGRLPSPRWRVVAWLGAAGIGGMCVLGALASEIGFQVSMTIDGPGASIANPLGVPGLEHPEQHPIGVVFFVPIVVALIGAVASLVVRFRRSRGAERQQLKWLMFAAALLPLTIAAEAFSGPVAETLEGLGFLVALNLIPLAIGVAILRYRLYEIDRIISRTLTYALLSVVLLGVYVSGVVGVGGVLRNLTGGTGGDLVVAATTLAIAALFQPLRRRVQSLVDRRFNRQRYDATRVVEGFAQRMRDAVDIDVLAEHVNEVVVSAVNPSSVSLWTPRASEEAR